MGAAGVRGDPARRPARAAGRPVAEDVGHARAPQAGGSWACCARCGRPATSWPAERDIAPGRVLPDAAMVAPRCRPTRRTRAALLELPVFRGRANRRLVGTWFGALAAAGAARADELPLHSKPGDGPPPVNRWADRDPAAAARLSAARAGLAELSEQWSVPVENLLSPDLVRRLMWSPRAADADASPPRCAPAARASGRSS